MRVGRILSEWRRKPEEQGDALAAQFGSQYDSRPIWDYITKAGAAVKK
jgi:hypothetical protein